MKTGRPPWAVKCWFVNQVQILENLFEGLPGLCPLRREWKLFPTWIKILATGGIRRYVCTGPLFSGSGAGANYTLGSNHSLEPFSTSWFGVFPRGTEPGRKYQLYTIRSEPTWSRFQEQWQGILA